jgi:transcription elongation factor GreA
MGGRGALPSPPMSTGESITPEGLEALKAELNTLETDGRQAMSARINDARSLGDLKENADYHIAKEDQAHLETKIKRLRLRLRDAVVVEPDTETSTFAFGRTAAVTDETTGKTHEWTIVGPTEANLSQGKLSAESPVAQALLGAKPGQVVSVTTPRGARNYKVERLV